MNAQIGRILIFIGIFIVVLGIIFLLSTNKPSLFAWFGKLPGDINMEKEQTRIFIPVTSMIIISIVLTLLINLFKKFFQ